MFSHIVVGTNDIERSRHFYDVLFGEPAYIDDKGRLIYARDGSRFLVTKPIDGEPATPANGGTIGFNLESVDAVDRWYESGIEAGGTAIEDPPGWRPSLIGKVYRAYLRDPDGNKLCGLHRAEQ